MDREETRGGWLEARRKASRMTCAPITWEDCRGWRIDGEHGAIVHRTGRFFSIVGTRTPAADASGAVEQPFILQPEVGLLGFVLHRDADGTKVLVQAKSEPGNVDLVQLAPTVQATISNQERVHGGAPTPYLALFDAGRNETERVSDGVQSEQGTRFLGKFNRNAVIRVGGAPPRPVSDVWRWLRIEELLGALRRDYTVNTDARSVLVCTPWAAYCNGSRPFGRHRGRGGIGEELWASYRSGTEGRAPDPDRILRRLWEWRSRPHPIAERVPLDALRGWQLEGDGLFSRDGTGIDVRPFETRATDREVSHWMQPLVAPPHPEEIALVAQVRDGVLRFLLRAAGEPGFASGPQIGPSVQTRDGRSPDDALGRQLLAADPARDVARAMQSDEGGRFHHSVGRYRVIRWPEDDSLPEPPDTVWATLGQIQALALQPGVLTNEARSALSLLLPEI